MRQYQWIIHRDADGRVISVCAALQDEAIMYGVVQYHVAGYDLPEDALRAAIRELEAAAEGDQ